MTRQVEKNQDGKHGYFFDMISDKSGRMMTTTKKEKMRRLL